MFELNRRGGDDRDVEIERLGGERRKGEGRGRETMEGMGERETMEGLVRDRWEKE
jgi:hypothetical protein